MFQSCSPPRTLNVSVTPMRRRCIAACALRRPAEQISSSFRPRNVGGTSLLFLAQAIEEKGHRTALPGSAAVCRGGPTSTSTASARSSRARASRTETLGDSSHHRPIQHQRRGDADDRYRCDDDNLPMWSRTHGWRIITRHPADSLWPAAQWGGCLSVQAGATWQLVSQCLRPHRPARAGNLLCRSGRSAAQAGSRPWHPGSIPAEYFTHPSEPRSAATLSRSRPISIRSCVLMSYGLMPAFAGLPRIRIRAWRRSIDRVAAQNRGLLKAPAELLVATWSGIESTCDRKLTGEG